MLRGNLVQGWGVCASRCSLLVAAVLVILGGCSKEEEGSGAPSDVCPSGYSDCFGACVALQSNALHCGACGAACTVGQICTGGACQCLSGSALCASGCAQTSSDGNNCGTCGTICPTGTVCSLGVCTTGCDSGLETCGTSCVDLATSPIHCGACDSSCMPGQDCVGGHCACAGGQTVCDGSCVDSQTNAAHCGACGRTCAPGEQCVEGACQCPPGSACGFPATGGGSGVGGSSSGGTPGVGGLLATGGEAVAGGGPEGGRSGAAPLGGMGGGITLGGAGVAGGAPPGGAGAGGEPTGGATPGGAAAGGSPSGGAATGGAATGGAPTGGAPTGGAPTGGSGGSSCGTGQSACNGQCVDLLYNNDHCGACGNACPLSGWCARGTCTCWDGSVECEGVCQLPSQCSSGTGGAGTGGAPTGGAPTGGAPTGGVPTGGAPTGGVPTGGAPTGGGGSTNTGGVSSTCQGWASRYWDCCKPHCAWSGNVASGDPVSSCDATDQVIGDNQGSACLSGPSFMCHSMAPWSVSSNLSYGYAAIRDTGSVCGLCYQLQFTGSSHNAGNDPGSSAISGKQMVVQVINVGGVERDQFDLLIPGGGVGDFDACSTQWQTSDIGARYGGFRTECSGTHQQIKDCVAQKCESVFGDTFPELYAGCMWYVEWFEAADNPSFNYVPVACPPELTGVSTMPGASPATECG